VNILNESQQITPAQAIRSKLAMENLSTPISRPFYSLSQARAVVAN
jgi:hypothetical protein